MNDPIKTHKYKHSINNLLPQTRDDLRNFMATHEYQLYLNSVIFTDLDEEIAESKGEISPRLSIKTKGGLTDEFKLSSGINEFNKFSRTKIESLKSFKNDSNSSKLISNRLGSPASKNSNTNFVPFYSKNQSKRGSKNLK